jgi:Golgi nucleoside diphosphatase
MPNEKYTDRISPGMSDFVDNFEGLKQYFTSMISYAKSTLRDYEDDWYTYPIYLRATGGMRLVPYEKREAIMTFTRHLFSDKTFCPFFFQFDFARVMSGEEEAVFSWASANYLFGTLLQSLPGSGAVIKPINGTFGIVDLGGASAQISFFIPSQDISEGLFKLQIGSQRHWNVYSKSFLSYGHNSARERHLQSVAIDAINNGADPKKDDISTRCFFSGYEEDVTVDLQKTHSLRQETVTIRGPHSTHSSQFDECYDLIIPLLKKELNVFCNVVYDNQCSMDGFYQPSLPVGIDGHFVASATYKYAWAFLQMPPSGSLTLFKDRARKICSMSYSDIKKYHNSLNTTTKKDELLPYYCFVTTYVAVLLESKDEF